MMQIFSRPFTIGNAVCHSSKVDKQLKTCNWVFAIYSFIVYVGCRVQNYFIRRYQMTSLLPTILRVIFGKTLQTVHYYLYQIFLSTCQFIFFTSCQFRLSRQQSRCQNILFLWSSSLWDRREDFLPIPNFWCLLKVCFIVNSNGLFTLI